MFGGVNVSYNLTPRLAVYAAAGAGIAVRSSRTTGVEITSGVSVNALTGVKVSPAANFGVGLDFRLSRSFSLRGEFREFRSTSLPTSLGGQS